MDEGQKQRLVTGVSVAIEVEISKQNDWLLTNLPLKVKYFPVF